MSDQIQITGKTVDEAIREALLRMGLRREEVDVTVIQEARGGIFGVGRRQAVVKVTKKARGRVEPTERPERGRRDERGAAGGRGGRPAGERLDDGRTGRGERGRGGRGERGRSDQPRTDQKQRDDGRGGAGRGVARGEARGEARVGGRGEGRNDNRRAGQGRGARVDNKETPRDVDVPVPAMVEPRADQDLRPEFEDDGRGGRRRRPRRRRKKFDGDEGTRPNVNGEVEASAEGDEAATTMPAAVVLPEVDAPDMAAAVTAPVEQEPEARTLGTESQEERPEPPTASYTRRGEGGTVAADVVASARVQPLNADEVAALPDFLQRVATELMVKSGFACRVQVQEGEYHLVKLVVDDRSAGVLIGRYGNTVDAVEYLVEKIASKAAGERVRMNLDINNYRVRREDQLVQRARNAAAEARNTGEPVALEPAGGRERRIVHLYIQEAGDLTTYTEVGPDGKFVVVCHADQVPAHLRDREDQNDDGDAPAQRIEVAAVIDVETKSSEPQADEHTAD